MPSVVAAEAVVQLGEHVRGGLDGGYVSETDAHSVLTLPRNGRLGRDQPAERGFVPRRLGRFGLVQRLVPVEISAPQLSDCFDRAFGARRIAGVQESRVPLALVVQPQLGSAGVEHLAQQRTVEVVWRAVSVLPTGDTAFQVLLDKRLGSGQVSSCPEAGQRFRTNHGCPDRVAYIPPEQTGPCTRRLAVRPSSELACGSE
ncbi:hypothetical protein GCM10010121_071630 [Streptomyces brasiliensis]|uniref:Uncharacterized protein n=1 Tax=Streptomyces brasiliensis TaxID=1954 RepID=A0A917L8X6_9ACTN|nr:hypothetical protein GCM10010121_071630 [Streptomyces brasiliensis]